MGFHRHAEAIELPPSASRLYSSTEGIGLDRSFGRFRFWTTPPMANREEGCTAVCLHRETVLDYDLQPVTDRQAAIVAEVVNGDAEGHSYLRLQL